VVVLVVCACAHASDVVRPIPMTEGKPFKDTQFGDSTKIPLQPVYTKETVNFIKNVLAPEMLPPVNVTEGVPEIHDNITAPSPAPQPRIPLAKMVEAFERYDIDQSGTLEIAEAKSIFDEFQIHFSSQSELDSFFDRQGFMHFDSFCDLLANKEISRSNDTDAAKEKFCRSLGLDTKYLVNSTRFHVQASAVTWIRKYLKQTKDQGPFPEPSAPAFLTQEEVDTAKAAIVEWRIHDTGRTDKVTYANAHLTKEAADQIVHEEKYLCHPALSETCSLASPCCKGLTCCPVQGKTGEVSGYCAPQC